jgi:hypothetical protein
LFDSREYCLARVLVLHFVAANFFVQNNFLSLGHREKVVDPVHFLEFGSNAFRAFAPSRIAARTRPKIKGSKADWASRAVVLGDAEGARGSTGLAGLDA